MLIGYARVSKADDSQVLDLQIDALLHAGVNLEQIYTDKISGIKDERPGLENCLKALREEDILVVWMHITVYPDTSVGLNRTVEEEIFSVAIF